MILDKKKEKKRKKNTIEMQKLKRIYRLLKEFSYELHPSCSTL